MNSRILLCCYIAALFCLPPTSTVHAQDSEERAYDLAVYTPRFLFSGNVARSLYAKKIATALSQSTGLTIRGRAFTRRSDLNNFISNGRIDLVLADIGIVASKTRKFHILASGTGPEGSTPSYAVLSHKAFKGIQTLKGKRLGLPDASFNEVALVSNIPFESEVSIKSFFGAIRWAHDVGELIGWLKTGRVDCAVGYAYWGRKQGLKVVSTLRGVPLPVLAAVRKRIKREDLELLTGRISRQGLDLPQHGLLSRLAPPRLDLLSDVTKMAALKPGERPAAYPIWSPMQMEHIPIGSYGAKPPNSIDLGIIRDRWRLPGFEDL